LVKHKKILHCFTFIKHGNAIFKYVYQKLFKFYGISVKASHCLQALKASRKFACSLQVGASRLSVTVATERPERRRGKRKKSLPAPL